MSEALTETLVGLRRDRSRSRVTRAVIVGAILAFLAVAYQFSYISPYEQKTLEHLAIAKSVLDRIPKRGVLVELKREFDIPSLRYLRRYQFRSAHEILITGPTVRDRSEIGPSLQCSNFAKIFERKL